MCVHGVPATKSTAPTAAQYTRAEPKSGWRKTRKIGIDARRDEQTKHPDHDVDRLAREVVPLVARNVVVRDACDRPEPVADEGPDATEQNPVEAPDEGRDLGRLAPAGAGCCTGVGDVV